jgi:diguanylate cyclase (GGDEF)-like protein
MIKHIASWLESATRSTDYVLRLGGDEFLIAAQLKRSFCEKVCNRLVNDAPPLVTQNGTQIPVSLSVGCIFYEPSKKDKVDPNWIIDQADQLMYDTKREGGKNVKILHINGKTRNL